VVPSQPLCLLEQGVAISDPPVVTIEVARRESARVNCQPAHGWSPMSFRQQSLDLAKFEMAFSRSFGVGHLEFSQRIKDDLGDD